MTQETGVMTKSLVALLEDAIGLEFTSSEPFSSIANGLQRGLASPEAIALMHAIVNQREQVVWDKVEQALQRIDEGPFGALRDRAARFCRLLFTDSESFALPSLQDLSAAWQQIAHAVDKAPIDTVGVLAAVAKRLGFEPRPLTDPVFADPDPFGAHLRTPPPACRQARIRVGDQFLIDGGVWRVIDTQNIDGSWSLVGPAPNLSRRLFTSAQLHAANPISRVFLEGDDVR